MNSIGRLRGMEGEMYSLGLEFSTQSVKSVVLDIYNAVVIHTGSFEYDSTFPEYKTVGGVIASEHSGIRHTDPLMLIEALDYALEKMKSEGIELSLIKAVKTDGMQHCTVYTDSSFGKKINSLNPAESLTAQLRSSITRKTSPIWEDRSPIREAQYIHDSLRDKGGIGKLTGNRAELRFPAAQILRWAAESPEEYRQTSHIFLLSAFITSILAGKIAPVDTGDGWGTNLNDLDINNPGWSSEVLTVANRYLYQVGLDEPLGKRLGAMDHYDAAIGRIGPYFVEKYGMDSDAVVLAGTGDNPATLLGCGGHIVVSLGSSYTVNGVMHEIAPSEKEEYNIFGYTRGSAMALSVFTNGGKVHEHFLKKYGVKSDNRQSGERDWDTYGALAGEPLLSDNETLMLPYLFDESVPLRKKGILRDGFEDDDAHRNIRALHISQALSLRLHASHLSAVNSLCVVGGGARNKLLRQIITDVFNTKTFTIMNADFAAPFGCAISGARTVLGISYDEATRRYVQPDAASLLEPIEENVPRVKALLDRYAALEKRDID